jgi:hypothetical protein
VMSVKSDRIADISVRLSRAKSGRGNPRLEVDWRSQNGRTQAR